MADENVGLGLVTCEQITENHAGLISTTFRDVMLPRRGAPSRAGSNPSPRLTEVRPVDAASSVTHNCRGVVLVDSRKGQQSHWLESVDIAVERPASTSGGAVDGCWGARRLTNQHGSLPPRACDL